MLITGAAGFIGFHLSRRLLADGLKVVGVDSLNPYYSVQLKAARLQRLCAHSNFDFKTLDIADQSAVEDLFKGADYPIVVHLAAQAGVRYSIDNPPAYVLSNLVGFANILEGVRRLQPEHFLYASSSSVYGATSRAPFSAESPADHPVSMYAATKRANELLAHSYSHLYGIPSTGLRFFTVYGPWGRPDMAYWTFTSRILSGQPIRLFNNGQMLRDFTYIDDVVESIVRLLPLAPGSGDPSAATPSTSFAPWRVLNIGNSMPVQLEHFVHVLENAAGVPAVREYLPMQAGDVPATHADVTALESLVGTGVHTPIEVGIPKFVRWFREYDGEGASGGR